MKIQSRTRHMYALRTYFYYYDDDLYAFMLSTSKAPGPNHGP